MESKVKQVQMALLEQKCDLLQKKYEALQAITTVEVVVLDIRLKQLDPNIKQGEATSLVGMAFKENVAKETWWGAFDQGHMKQSEVEDTSIVS